MIKHCEEHSNSVIKLGDNLIELKMLGAIFVEVYTNSIVMELHLKNGNYKKLEVSDEVHKFTSKAWLEELDRRNKEDKYPPCDTCGKELNYMPWHYSENDNRHLHSCNDCWKDIKKRIYKGENE